MQPYFSARPYTEVERDREANERKQAEQRLFNRRKAMRSGQRYNKTGTPALRKQYENIGGK